MTAVRAFADVLADVIEQGASHPWDGGMRADMDRMGITAAGRRRMAEQLREQAVAARATQPDMLAAIAGDAA